jgi:hypothetical protein
MTMRTPRIVALITFSAALTVAQTVNCTVLSISQAAQTNNTCNAGAYGAPISNTVNFSGNCNFSNCGVTQTPGAGPNPQSVTASGVCGCIPLGTAIACLATGPLAGACWAAAFGNLTPAFSTVFDTYASDGSPLSGHGTATNWSLLGVGVYGIPLPVCQNGSSSNTTTEYQCTASSGTCGNNTSQCGADGCDC